MLTIIFHGAQDAQDWFECINAGKVDGNRWLAKVGVDVGTDVVDVWLWAHEEFNAASYELD